MKPVSSLWPSWRVWFSIRACRSRRNGPSNRGPQLCPHHREPKLVVGDDQFSEKDLSKARNIDAVAADGSGKVWNFRQLVYQRTYYEVSAFQPSIQAVKMVPDPFRNGRVIVLLGIGVLRAGLLRPYLLEERLLLQPGTLWVAFLWIAFR